MLCHNAVFAETKWFQINCLEKTDYICRITVFILRPHILLSWGGKSLYVLQIFPKFVQISTKSPC